VVNDKTSGYSAKSGETVAIQQSLMPEEKFGDPDQSTAGAEFAMMLPTCSSISGSGAKGKF
jgi:hypothetical protein